MAVNPNEIEIVRVYEAPVKMVWAAWTDLRKVAKWWGPRGMTITTSSRDLKPGGKWIYDMHAPDGVTYPNMITYREVIPEQKLAYDHGTGEDAPKHFGVVVTFKEEKGRTVMKMTMTLPTAQAATETRKMVKVMNGNSTWDRLGEHLNDDQSFIYNRTIKATVDRAQGLFTNPEDYVRWMGPTGAQMKFLNSDVREGGHSLWSMKMPDGSTKHGVLHYEKISPTVFTYRQHFSDEQGKLRKAFFSESYPDELRTTISFTAESPTETFVTITWEPLPGTTAHELQTFHEMKHAMTVGWSQSFDKIDEILET